jgi:hypothetical protein
MQILCKTWNPAHPKALYVCRRTVSSEATAALNIGYVKLHNAEDWHTL